MSLCKQKLIPVNAGGVAWFIVLGMMILYNLTLIFVGIQGILLVKDLIRDSRDRGEEAV